MQQLFKVNSLWKIEIQDNFCVIQLQKKKNRIYLQSIKEDSEGMLVLIFKVGSVILWNFKEAEHAQFMSMLDTVLDLEDKKSDRLYYITENKQQLYTNLIINKYIRNDVVFLYTDSLDEKKMISLALAQSIRLEIIEDNLYQFENLNFLGLQKIKLVYKEVAKLYQMILDLSQNSSLSFNSRILDTQGLLYKSYFFVHLYMNIQKRNKNIEQSLLVQEELL